MVVVGNKEKLMDLIVLSITDFVLVLGVDWLATFHVTLDYHLQLVKFNPYEEPFFLVQVD